MTNMYIYNACYTYSILLYIVRHYKFWKNETPNFIEQFLIPNVSNFNATFDQFGHTPPTVGNIFTIRLG